ncbi:ABC transporter ATP-binding protein [Clostridium tarantellae]|uniref:ATP-binding cassette domain-containing protein n=1 Tax=Clostridium tarantellae TaxID=39493 RepID=A0A6I1MMG6_9CLOT|nr:ABC transporter ATP-binding protein [Clostridium tarantellae]MPQ43953.1 ATP-binding cassette domain-containing protein [Clostridium tarantellae]
MSYLSINKICKNYNTPSCITESLKDITFEVSEGDFISILGPSGCGKSTLLNIISGLILPSNGKIFYKDNPLKYHTDIFGYMFQKDQLFEWLSVYNNVILGLKIKKQLSKENLYKINSLLDLYGLSKFKNHTPSQLSGGMRQRVALIRTLSLNPEILLLDEPFSALDYQTRLKVCDEIYNIIKQQNKTVIMVSHDISEAISTSSKIIILSKRPSIVKCIFKLDFPKKLSPLQRRDAPNFKEYFNIIWKELDGNE